MKFLDITFKDLYQLFKDWKPVIFLVVAPIVFTLMFGFMFGGFSGPNVNTDSRLPIRVLNEEDTAITASLISYLENSSVIRVEQSDNTETLSNLKRAIADDDIAAALIIPAGFSDSVMKDGTIDLTAILDENTTTGITVQQEIQSAINRLQTAADTATQTVDLYAQKQSFTNQAEQDALYNETFTTALEAWKTPPVTAVEIQTAPNGSQQTSEENAFAQSLPGMMAQFAIAGLMGAAEIIIQERKSGALDRILSTAVPKFSILVGHWLAMFVMILMQFVVLVAFGQIFLRLDFLAAPLATLALSLLSCAFVASLGLLIGILAKMPEQSAIFALIPMFIFSGLGGAWVPLDILGESVQKIARFTPVYWIMTGFRDILLRGADLTEVWVSITALAGFSVIFFIPAVILFYRKRH
jgi:ABC-2 type transport system permease protein